MYKIFGPSHCARLDFYFKSNQLISPSSLEVDGEGGRPIWSPEHLKQILNATGKVLIFVPDFRFGNGTNFSCLPENLFELEDDFFLEELSKIRKVSNGVVKNKITKDSDDFLYKLSVRCLDIINKNVLGVKFIFWCLTIRERDNRARGKYFFEGCYQHPAWNLSCMLSQYYCAINTMPVVEKKIKFLHIDTSGHPSILGYLTILRAFLKNEDFLLSMKHVYPFIKSEYSKIASFYESKGLSLVFIGESKLSKIYKNFSKKGIFPDFQNFVFFYSDYSQALGSKEFNNEKSLLVFQDDKELSFACASESLHSFKVVFFPYDSLALKIVSLRSAQACNHGFSNFEINVSQDLPFNISSNDIESVDFLFDTSFLELNETCYPTLKGVMSIFFNLISSFDKELANSYYSTLLRKMQRLYD